MDIDTEYIFFNNDKKYIQITQLLMIGLGILSIVSWEMSDYAKELENRK